MSNASVDLPDPEGAADDHKFVAGDVEREVLEVVLARALDMDGGMTHEVP